MTPATQATLARLAEIEARDKELEAGPWCEEMLYNQIRHVDRNCEFECETHENNMGECRTFGRYDGPNIAKMRTDVPALCAALRELQARLTEAEGLLKDLYVDIPSTVSGSHMLQTAVKLYTYLRQHGLVGEKGDGE